MSTQTSLVTFTGKMGGISFYKRHGKHVARKAGGPSRKRILTAPAFVRTRENMSEFGGLALASSSFSGVFAPVKDLRDTRLRSRTAKIFRSMMKQDDGVRGQRQAMVTQHRSDLLGFELNGDHQLQSSFGAKFTATHSADRKTATLTIADLRVNSMITAPPGATHFQLVQLAGVLADTVFNAESKEYEPSDAVLNEVSNVTYSDYIAIDNAAAQPVNLQTVLPQDVNDKVSVVQAIGIVFFTKTGTAYYPSQRGKAMQIVDVY